MRSLPASQSGPVLAGVPPVIRQNSRQSFWWPALGIAMLAGAIVLYLYNPVEARLYPFCLFYQSTGFLCPGCGSLRAGHNLLHGHFVRALQCNCVVAGMALGAMLYFAAKFFFLTVARRAQRERSYLRELCELPVVKPIWVWLLFAILCGYAVARNLPLAPGVLVWLRP